MTVSAPAKTVKRINTQRHRSSDRGAVTERTSGGRSGGSRRAKGKRKGKKNVIVENVDLDNEFLDNEDYEDLY